MSNINTAEYTKGGRKKSSYELIAKWVLESFNTISAEAVVSAFKKSSLG